MTEFKKADTNGNGVIEKVEWNKLALEDRRLEIVDRDLKRNAERRFTGFALAGMLIYPFIILLASVLGFDKSSTLKFLFFHLRKKILSQAYIFIASYNPRMRNVPNNPIQTYPRENV